MEQWDANVPQNQQHSLRLNRFGFTVIFKVESELALLSHELKPHNDVCLTSDLDAPLPLISEWCFQHKSHEKADQHTLQDIKHTPDNT